MSKKVLRIVAITLILAMCFGTTAFASVQGSQYIDSYNAFLNSPSAGKVEVWFDVKGNATSDEVGVLTVILRSSTDKENWTAVKTFRYFDYSNMLAYDTMKHVSHVDYEGETGVYYQAQVTVWVGDGGDGDSRIILTPAILA